MEHQISTNNHAAIKVRSARRHEVTAGGGRTSRRRIFFFSMEFFAILSKSET